MKYTVEHYELTDACRNTAARVIELAVKSYMETTGSTEPPPLAAQDAIADGWKNGSYRLIVARDDANTVQGYQLWTYGAGTWSATVIAELRSIFIEPAFRGRGDLDAFIDFGVMAIKIMGAKQIDLTADADSRLHKYLKRKGWVDHVVSMRLAI
jgi:GNAT superfamily N-acetyltransferase